MPLYEFVCKKCHKEQELLVRGEEKPHCESCGSGDLQKLLSAPVAHSNSPSARSGEMPGGGCGSGCCCHPH